MQKFHPKNFISRRGGYRLFSTGKFKTVLLSILIFSVQLIYGQNLIPNYGFEEGISAGHELRAYNGSEVYFSGTAAEKVQGDSALKIVIDSIGTGGPQVIGIRHYLNELETLKSYTMRVALKGPVGQKFRFRVHGDQKQVKNCTVLSDQWAYYTFDIESLQPSSDGEHIVALEFAFKENISGAWYIDSLVFEPGKDIPQGALQRAFVSPEGNDLNDGTLQSPFKTLERAVEMLAGDTLYLLRGVYHQENRISDFSGSAGAPKVLMPYPGHKVVFDGTIPVSNTWELYSGNIYRTKIDTHVWQIFQDGEMLNLCRWPNVTGFIEDEQPVSPDPLPLSLWDQEGTWGHSADNSSNGVMIDDGSMGLAGSGLDMTGAIAVLNIGSFKTSAAPVAEHHPGDDHFTYEPAYTDPFLTWQKPNHAHYYLEGKMNLLDHPGEWFYAQDSGILYLVTKNGLNPADVEIRGKNQSYAMILDNCDYLEIRNINFNATTLRGTNCSNLTIENCEFNYPSYSKRILGEYGETDVTIFDGSSDHFTFRNNIVQYAEGEALHLEGGESLIENNLIRHVDFSCVNLQMIGGTINFKRENNIFRHNTLYVAGASETITPGSNNTVEGNEAWSIGHLQNDGSIIQYMVAPTVGSITRFNWLHDCKKMGMRYDGSLTTGNTGTEGVWDPWGKQTKGQVYGNVIWNCPTGLMIKGDYHVIVNNTVFDNEKVSIVMMNPPPAGANQHSICKNNIGDMISGYRGGRDPDQYPLPGDHSHNWNGYYHDEKITDLLQDIQNRDFRPAAADILVETGNAGIYSDDLIPEFGYIDSVYDIGAHEYGDTIYYIPGRRVATCSAPVPADGSVSGTADLMLAWRPAYRSTRFHIYTGSDYKKVLEAGTGSSEFRGEQLKNVFIPDPLLKDSTLYWRVDAVWEDSITKGKVWSLIAGTNANGAVLDTTSDIAFIVNGDEGSLKGVKTTLNGEIKETDEKGRVSFTGFRNDFTYHYTLEKSGYRSSEGSIYLEKDTTLSLTLDIESGVQDEVSCWDLELFPNPADNEVLIRGNSDILSMKMIDIHGKVIRSIQTVSVNDPIDISPFEEGVYFLSLELTNRRKIWKSFVISR